MGTVFVVEMAEDVVIDEPVVDELLDVVDDDELGEYV